MYIWYPEIGLEARLAEGSTALVDSIDGNIINRETPITFLINFPQVASTFLNVTSIGTIDQAAYAKVVLTTPAGGKTTAFVNGNYATIQLKGTQTQDDVTTATESATAGTYTAHAEYINYVQSHRQFTLLSLL